MTDHHKKSAVATEGLAALGPSDKPDIAQINISKAASCTAFCSAGSAALCIVILHALKPDLDPSWRFLSEYSVGQHGWIMQLAFLLMGLSFGSLVVALRREARSITGVAGLVFLAISALGTVIAGIYNMDPITIIPPQPTTDGNLHALGSMLGVPTLPIAAMLITIALVRGPFWNDQRRRLLLSANLTWASLALMVLILSVSLSANNGQFGPDVSAGWPNRLVVATYLAWIMLTAAKAADLAQRPMKAVR
jgi:hypothetical protein